MARPTDELSPEYRRRLRRIAKRAAESDAELRAAILDGWESESKSAIARELGIETKTLWARVQAWGKIPDPHDVKGAK